MSDEQAYRENLLQGLIDACLSLQDGIYCADIERATEFAPIRKALAACEVDLNPHWIDEGELPEAPR